MVRSHRCREIQQIIQPPFYPVNMKTARALSLSLWRTRVVKRAWLLHGYLVAMMILFPSGGGLRATAPDGFVNDRIETTVDVALSAPQGTSGLNAGTQYPLEVVATVRSWQVYVDPETGNSHSELSGEWPLEGASVQFVVDWGAGWTSGDVATDSTGHSTGAFTMGSSAAGVRAIVQYADQAVAEAAISFDAPCDPNAGGGNFENSSPPSPVWAVVRGERSITVAISTSESPYGLATGAQSTVTANVMSTTWDVLQASYNGVPAEEYCTGNYQSSPAIGAVVNWSVVSGDGTVTGDSSTGIDGAASGLFVMGFGASSLSAQVSFADSNTANASIDFTIPSTEGSSQGTTGWYQEGSMDWWSLQELTVNGPQYDLSPGDQCAVSGRIYRQSCEVWTDGLGNYNYLNVSSDSTAGIQIPLQIAQGDGVLSTSSAMADDQGWFTFTYTAGAESSDVSVAGDSAGGNPSIVQFTNISEDWTQVGSYTQYFIGLTSDQSTSGVGLNQSRDLVATLVANEYVVMESSLKGPDQRVHRLVNTYFPVAAQVDFSFATSDGTVAYASGSTNSSGEAAIAVTMGASELTIEARMAGDPACMASLTFTPAPLQKVWVFDYQEATVGVSLSPSISTPLAPGETTTLNAQVTYEAWNVYHDEDNPTLTKREVYSSGTAEGATVLFSVASGEGGISDYGGLTDSNGVQTTTFTMGADEMTRVEAVVAFMGATAFGTREFTLAQWAKIGDDKRLNVELTAAPSGYGATANVTRTTWEVWKRGGQTEPRSIQTGPAINAVVDFSFEPAGGTATPPTSYTTANGDAATTYSVTDPSALLATATFDGLTASASLSVTAKGTGWIHLSDGDELLLSLSADTSAGSVQATVQQHTWESWIRGAETEIRNDQTVPAAGAMLTFAITQGSGTVTPMAVIASELGEGGAAYSVSQPSTIRCQAALEQVTASATVQVPNNDETVGGNDGPYGPLPDDNTDDSLPYGLVPKDAYPGEVPDFEFIVRKREVRFGSGLRDATFGFRRKPLLIDGQPQWDAEGHILYPEDPEYRSYTECGTDGQPSAWFGTFNGIVERLIPNESGPNGGLVPKYSSQSMNEEQAWEMITLLRQDEQFQHIGEEFGGHLTGQLPTQSDPPVPGEIAEWLMHGEINENDTFTAASTQGQPEEYWGEITVEEVANNADFGLSDLVINLFFPQPTPDALDPLHPELGTFKKSAKESFHAGCTFAMNDYATPKKRYDGSKVEVKWRLKNWDHFKPATARRTLYLFNRVERPNPIPGGDPLVQTSVSEVEFLVRAGTDAERSVSSVMVLDPAIHNAFYDTQNAEELPVIVTMDLLPIDIVAVFGDGGEVGKAKLTAYLDAASIQKAGKVYLVKGKDKNGADKNYAVLVGDTQAELQQGLSTPGCIVLYDGHSNEGIGPQFIPNANVSRLSDLMNVGNPQAAINLRLWKQGCPNFTLPDAEAAGNVTNYDVPNFDAPDKLRYPNSDGVGAGGVFQRSGTGLDRNHYGNGNPKNYYLIVKAGAADLPALNYDTFFFNVCDSGRDFMEVFNRGRLLYTNSLVDINSPTSKVFVENVINGKSWADVLAALNQVENLHKQISR